MRVCFRKYRGFSVLAVACVLALAACNGASSDSQVHVQGFRLVETPSGQRQVMGTLHNASSRAIANAQVQVSLFDANNIRVATMNVNVSDIPASGEVQFKKPLTTEAKVDGARVRSVLVM